MPKTGPPYSPEFRRQIVELVRAGRDPDDLAREFEPTGQSIRNLVAQADLQEGLDSELAPLRAGGRGIVLGEGGAYPSRDDAALRLARIGQGVAHEVDAGAAEKAAGL